MTSHNSLPCSGPTYTVGLQGRQECTQKGQPGLHQQVMEFQHSQHTPTPQPTTAAREGERDSHNSETALMKPYLRLRSLIMKLTRPLKYVVCFWSLELTSSATCTHPTWNGSNLTTSSIPGRHCTAQPAPSTAGKLPLSGENLCSLHTPSFGNSLPILALSHEGLGQWINHTYPVTLLRQHALPEVAQCEPRN